MIQDFKRQEGNPGSCFKLRSDLARYPVKGQLSLHHRLQGTSRHVLTSARGAGARTRTGGSDSSEAWESQLGARYPQATLTDCSRWRF